VIINAGVCAVMNVAVCDPRWKDLIELVAGHLHGCTADPANQRAAVCLQRLTASADVAYSAYVHSVIIIIIIIVALQSRPSHAETVKRPAAAAVAASRIAYFTSHRPLHFKALR